MNSDIKEHDEPATSHDNYEEKAVSWDYYKKLLKELVVMVAANNKFRSSMCVSHKSKNSEVNKVKTYKVNADFYINVQVEVEAESEEAAKEEAKQLILNKDCEWLDPISDPVINWAEGES